MALRGRRPLTMRYLGSAVVGIGALACAACAGAPSGAGPAAPGSAGPRAELPVYARGETWIRSDGEYELVRVEPDRYIFHAAGPDNEVHLTKELGFSKVRRRVQVIEFEPPLRFDWPLQVGKRGESRGIWRVPRNPAGEAVRLTWSVDAYEDVKVVAGTFKAFRISLRIERPGLRRLLQAWYAPDVRRFVKAYGDNLGLLSFELAPAVAPRRSPPPQIRIDEPRDQARLATARVVLSGAVTASAGVVRVSVTLNDREVATLEGPPRWDANLGVFVRSPQKEVSLRVPITLEEGTNIVVVTAADPQGNIREETRIFFYDKPAGRRP